MIGCGGIVSADDALDFLCVGCRAVQIGTATFVTPTAALDVLRGIAAVLRAEGRTLASVIGSYRE